MLPDSFIEKPFAPTVYDETGNTTPADAVNDRLLALEKKILSGSHYAGQSRNRLLEETDQHIKARLLCAIRIETLHSVISEMVDDGVISRSQLSELLNDKTDFITNKQQVIWLNQLTQERDWPLYYSFEG